METRDAPDVRTALYPSPNPNGTQPLARDLRCRLSKQKKRAKQTEVIKLRSDEKNLPTQQKSIINTYNPL